MPYHAIIKLFHSSLLEKGRFHGSQYDFGQSHPPHPGFYGALLIGNVFQQFYNIADIIIVGRTIGVNALALSVRRPVYMSVFGVTIGLSAGFSVIVGQRFGAKDMEGLRRSVATSTMLAFVITLLVTAGVSLAMPLILRVMNISGVLYDDAYHYMIIIVLGLMP